MGRTAAQLCSWVAATMLGTWCVLQVDALSIVARGGSPAAMLIAHALATLLGAGAGLALWAAGRSLWQLGDALARAAQRGAQQHGGPASWPLVVVIVGGALAGTFALAPAHRVFSSHPATTALLLTYLPFALAALLALAAWLLRSGRLRVPAVLCAVLAVGALHLANLWYYPGLYRPVHDALTGVALAVATAGSSLVLATVPPRVLLRSIAGAFALAALSFALAGSIPSQRTLAFFDGTELHHVLAWMEGVLDADGDGLRAVGGDCDDSRRDVHPMRLERPSNGVDDNCRLGDRASGSIAASTRAAAEAPGLARWRAAHPRPNLLLVFVDTLRADVLGGAYGSEQGLTPALDAFAATATVFEQARTTSPRTEPALASLFRARFHGRNLACRKQLVVTDPVLASQLAARGYATAARLVGDRWLGSSLVQGWDEVVQKDTFNVRADASVTSDALRILQRLEPPFALLVHYADPHSPYLTHAGVRPRGAGVRAAYGAEVEATDREVGKLLEGLRAAGRLEDTVVVVFSDHGENLGERGSRGGHHGVSVYDEDVRVPLMIRAPGTGARRVDAPVSIVDIAPTVLDLIGAPPLSGADGRSLAGHLIGEPPAPTWTLSEYYAPPYHLRGFVDGRFKLVQDVGNGVHRLFDLGTDPGERVDVAAAQSQRVRRMVAQLDRWLETRADPSEPDASRCTAY